MARWFQSQFDKFASLTWKKFCSSLEKKIHNGYTIDLNTILNAQNSNLGACELRMPTPALRWRVSKRKTREISRRFHFVRVVAAGDFRIQFDLHTLLGERHEGCGLKHSTNSSLLVWGPVVWDSRGTPK